MDYGFISNMGLEEVKNYIRIRESKVNRRKNKLVAKVFAASENQSKLLCMLKLILKNEYLAKLKIKNRNISDSFKVPHR